MARGKLDSMRLRPLAAALGFTCGAAALLVAAPALATGQRSATGPKAHTLPASVRAAVHASGANFQRLLAEKIARGRAEQAAGTPRPAANVAVSNCNDSGAGSFRDAVATAVTGDVVDMSALVCSTISLTTGSVDTVADDLTLLGPAATTLTIDAGGASVVVNHYGNGTLSVQNLTLANGDYTSAGVAPGGCVFSAASVSLSNSRVTGCTATGPYAYGGGVFAVGDLSIDRSNLSNNAAVGNYYAGYGGGAFAVGNLTVGNSTLTGNTATYTAAYGYPYFGQGGGAASGGNFTVTGSAVTGNNADIGAGLAARGGALSVVNSTVSGNQATAAAGGIAAFGPLSLRNSTVSFNDGGTAFGGGGVVTVDTGSPEFDSTILSNNTTTGTNYDANLGSYYPLVATGANNLIVSSSNVTVPPGTLTGDPLLAALANNGGTTLTHALQAGSPAIDTGNNVAALAFDQRGTGFVRAAGVAADIGAFEIQAPGGPPGPTPLTVVPTLSQWGIGLMIGLLALFGLRRSATALPKRSR